MRKFLVGVLEVVVVSLALICLLMLFSPPNPDYSKLLRERDSAVARSNELEAANRVLQVASSHYAEAAMRAEGELNLLRAQCGPVVTLGARLSRSHEFGTLGGDPPDTGWFTSEGVKWWEDPPDRAVRVLAANDQWP